MACSSRALVVGSDRRLVDQLAFILAGQGWNDVYLVHSVGPADRSERPIMLAVPQRPGAPARIRPYPQGLADLVERGELPAGVDVAVSCSRDPWLRATVRRAAGRYQVPWIDVWTDAATIIRAYLPGSPDTIYELEIEPGETRRLILAIGISQALDAMAGAQARDHRRA